LDAVPREVNVSLVAPLFPGEIGYREFMAHIGEDDLERYVMKKLPDAQLDALEDHLLICPECREQLVETERYVLAIRAAAAKIQESGATE
jgi:anti-sigma factor RsiW